MQNPQRLQKRTTAARYPPRRELALDAFPHPCDVFQLLRLNRLISFAGEKFPERDHRQFAKRELAKPLTADTITPSGRGRSSMAER